MPPPVGFPPVGGGLYPSGPVTRRAARGRPTAASGAAASAAAGAAAGPAPAPASAPAPAPAPAPVVAAYVRPDDVNGTLGQFDDYGAPCRYNPSFDISRLMDVGTLSKSLKARNYFGADISGKEASDRGHTELDDFNQRLATRLRPHLYYTCYMGTILNYLLYPDWSPPDLIIGNTYTPGPEETWQPFIASQESIDDLAWRSKIIRQYLYELLYEFSTGIWHTYASNVAESQDGQAVLRTWQTHFLDDTEVSVYNKAKSLEDVRIKKTENPQVKLQALLTGWTEIQATQHKARYNVAWFVGVIANMIKNNICYSVWKQSGNTAVLLSCTSPAIAIDLVNKAYTQNIDEWKTLGYDKKDDNHGKGRQNNERNRANNSKGGKGKNRSNSRKGGGKWNTKGGKGKGQGGKGNKGGSKGFNKQNNFHCTNCNKSGHTADYCMQEGGGRELKCYACGKYGHYADQCLNPSNKSHHSNRTIGNRGDKRKKDSDSDSSSDSDNEDKRGSRRSKMRSRVTSQN